MSNLSRRAVMGAAPALIASTAFPAAAMGLTAHDPVFAAIEAHRAAYAAFGTALENEPASDDPARPEWEANEELFGDAEEAAAWALVEADATTIAGVIALCRYAVESWNGGRGGGPVGTVRAKEEGEEARADYVEFEIDAFRWVARSLERIAGGGNA